MSPERWQRLEDLYHAAATRPAEERRAFLEQACPGDTALRDEVASLLDHASTEDPTMTAPLASRIQEGSMLGHYRVEQRIGAGGMGDVFRAVDTRLNRSVAIKLSHGPFSLRFRREALVLSSLNHPHICTLFDVGPDFLVMELVEGETLQARLQRGPIPLTETTRLGAQIADALADAHAKGITHRDLKPGNVMVTKNGVKLLDFGLAAVEGDSLTKPGAVMGTPAYMSPEQFKGTDSGPQTDIYALGLLLHELASGRRPVVQPGEPAILAKLPGPLQPIVERCLAEDPNSRWRGAGEIRALLEVSGESGTVAELTPPARSRRPLLWAGATLLTISAALALWVLNLPGETGRGVALEVDLTPPPNTSFRVAGNFDGGFALSPDGTMLAFVGRSNGVANLWVRKLDSHEARMLPGTERAYYPFWSPDSKAVGYFTSGPSELKRIAADGTNGRTLAALGLGAAGGAWLNDGTIIIGSPIAIDLLRVSADGGETTALPMKGFAPHALPDGRRFIYSATYSDRKGMIKVASLNESKPRDIGIAGLWPQYSAGYIASFLDGRFVAQPFDLETERFTGEPFPVADIANQTFVTGGYRATFSVSPGGALVYPPMSHVMTRLVWRDRTGKLLVEAGAPAVYNSPRISPDGKKIIYSRRESANTDVWIADADNAAPVQFTSAPGVEQYPVWSKDGSEILYAGDIGEARNLFRKPSAGGAAQRLFESPYFHQTLDWSKDGHITYMHINVGGELFVVPPGGAPYSLLGKQSPSAAQFSPGPGIPRWITYSADDTGNRRREVFVMPFVSGRTGDPDRIQLSDNGGSHNRWRADGKAVYYHALDGSIMEVPVDASGPTFQHGKPIPLFRSVVPQTRNPDYLFDVTADGQRFLIVEPIEKAETLPLTLVTDWRASLKK